MKRHFFDSVLIRFALPASLVAVGFLSWANTVAAQPVNPDLRLSVTGGLLPLGETLESEVLLDNQFDPVSGWQYFVSYVDYQINLVSLTSGPGVATVLNGGPPEFEVLQDIGGVYQHAVTINSAPPLATIPPGTGRTLSIATYAPFTFFLGDTPVEFSSTPVFPNSVSDGSGQAWTALTSDNTITVTDFASPNFNLFFDAPTLEPGPNEIRVMLTSAGDSLSAWSYGAEYDDPSLVVAMLETGAATLIANNGSPPVFEDFDVAGSGFLHVVIVDSSLMFGLPPGVDQELAVATLTAPPGYQSETTIRFVATLGVPVTVVPLNLGFSLPPGTTPYCLTTNHSFDRGDCNDDGMFGIADAVFGLAVVFQGEDANCRDACDSNDSEQIDIADPVYTLNALFNGGTPPPGSGNCRMDPSGAGFGELACLEATACP